jgi:Flp pilus assembly protein TadG
MRARDCCRRLVADRGGAVAIELALVLPMVLTLLVGSVETVNYVLIHQKLERTSATLSDLVAQSSRMTEGLMRNLFASVDAVMQPYDLAADGVVRVTSVSARDGNEARVDWQRSSGDGDQASEVGQPGEDATLPEGLVLRDGDNVIVCEAWFVYRPVLLNGVLPGAELYRSAVFRPRFGRLDVIHP